MSQSEIPTLVARRQFPASFGVEDAMKDLLDAVRNRIFHGAHPALRSRLATGLHCACQNTLVGSINVPIARKLVNLW